jgi:hypothetical protein
MASAELQLVIEHCRFRDKGGVHAIRTRPPGGNARQYMDQKLTVVDPQALQDILIGVTKSGASAALFWTSEGYHDGRSPGH